MMAEIFGYTVEEMTSAPLLDFIFQDDRPLVSENVRKRIEGQVESVHYALRGLRKDGTVIYTEAYGGRIEYNGRPAIQGMLLDTTERKRAEFELEQTHNQLLAVSRQAGVAEFATGILHNVGNVLNSVNTAADCLAESLKKSDAAGLRKLVALFREHESDLGGFFTNNPKGRLVPNYLANLADQLSGEHARALGELAQLQEKIEHIKDIVRMQQDSAKVSGTSERLNLADLVEDALAMNANGLARSNVQVVKEFAEIPPLTVEKHKVLQILVNLVRNAMQACDGVESPDKRLTARVDQGNGCVRIAIADTGCGIAPENLTRIFSHGFTTKKDGHGFGLHSARLAAN
jgi:PAS domain S-box-containing protein